MKDRKLDRRKSYEFIDFNVTQAAVDFLKANPGWGIYSQRTMDLGKSLWGGWGNGMWTKTKIYREAPTQAGI